MRETSYLASCWIAINNSQKQIVYTINATDMVDYLTYSLQGPAASNRTFTPNPPRPHKPTHIPISISPRPTQPPYEFPPRSCRRTSTWHASYKCRACTGSRPPWPSVQSLRYTGYYSLLSTQERMGRHRRVGLLLRAPFGVCVRAQQRQEG